MAEMAVIAVAAEAAGSMIQGVSQARSAMYQAQVARNNKLTAERYAAYAAQQGVTQGEIEGLKARSELGSVRARAAAQGVDVNTGSAADVQTGQRKLGAFGQAEVMNRAAQSVYGYETQAQSFESEVRSDRAAAGWDIIGATAKAAGDVAGGMADLPSGGGGALSTATQSAAGFPTAINTAGMGSDIEPSLVSANPTLGDNYAWMRDSYGGANMDIPPFFTGGS